MARHYLSPYFEIFVQALHKASFSFLSWLAATISRRAGGDGDQKAFEAKQKDHIECFDKRLPLK
jgi:hypothetical protein